MPSLEQRLINIDTYLHTELPHRAVTLRGFSGDPRTKTDGVVVRAPIGTFYLQEDNNNRRWERYGSDPSQWREISGVDAGTSALKGVVHVTNVEPRNGGTVIITWEPNTNDAVVQSFVTNTFELTITLDSRSLTNDWIPNVELDGQLIPDPGPSWVEQPNGRFQAQIDITLSPAATQLVADYIDGGTHIVNLLLDTSGPSVNSVSLAQNPLIPTSWGLTAGLRQTTLKAGDEIEITGTVDSDAVYVEVVDDGIFSSGNVSINQGEGSFTLTGIVSNRTQTGAIARLRARNYLGTWGPVIDVTAQPRNLEQVLPTIAPIIINYPVDQGALKDSEQASISSTVANMDYTIYSTYRNELTIPNPNIYSASKTVTRNNLSGINYNDSNINYEITARKVSNGSETIRGTVVEIANIAPVVGINGATERLISSTIGYNHPITLVSDQKLLQAPELETQVDAGQLQSFTGSDKIWNNILVVIDSDIKGTHNWILIEAVNKAGLTANIITLNPSYTLGGFETRRVIFDSFNPTSNIGTTVTDPNKVIALDLGGNAMTLDIDNVPKYSNPKRYFVQAGDSTLYWTDQSAIDENSQGTAFIDITEES